MKSEANGNGRGHEPGYMASAPLLPPSAPKATLLSTDGLSGRRFLMIAGAVFLVLWGGLYLGFREWRARYLQRAAYGDEHVVPAVDPLITVVPSGSTVSRDEWIDAVERTHTMLETVVGSNLLDIEQMKALRDELDARVANSRNHPDQAVAELSAIWDRMADHAPFLLTTKDRHPRPKVLTRP